MTFPSLACDTCKRRRIKCDATQPACQRCTKSRRQCPGMRNGTSSIMHQENAYASGTRKRPRGPRAASPPPQQVPLSLTNQAIAYYLHHHVQPFPNSPSIVRGIEDDIASIFASRPSCPTIYLSISVIALALYGKTEHQSLALVEACIAYQTLLRQTQASVCSSLSENSIETSLFTTFCMSRYEDVVYRPSSPHSRSFTTASHHDGSLALLRAWREDFLPRSAGEGTLVPSIVKHTRRGMIRSAMLRNRPLPEWVHDGRDFGEEKGLELEYDTIALKLISLRHQLRGDGSQAMSLLQEVLALDADLVTWKSHFPPSWAPQKHPTGRIPQSNHDVEPQSINIYTHPFHASLHARYNATRILLNSTLLLPSPSSFPPSQFLTQTQALSILTTMCHDLQSTILPFFTATNNDETATRWLAWPLTMALRAEGLQGEWRGYFSDRLAEMGRKIGIGVFEEAEEIMSGFK